MSLPTGFSLKALPLPPQVRTATLLPLMRHMTSPTRHPALVPKPAQKQIPRLRVLLLKARPLWVQVKRREKQILCLHHVMTREAMRNLKLLNRVRYGANERIYIIFCLELKMPLNGTDF